MSHIEIQNEITSLISTLQEEFLANRHKPSPEEVLENLTQRVVDLEERFKALFSLKAKQHFAESDVANINDVLQTKTPQTPKRDHEIGCPPATANISSHKLNNLYNIPFKTDVFAKYIDSALNDDSGDSFITYEHVSKFKNIFANCDCLDAAETYLNNWVGLMSKPTVTNCFKKSYTSKAAVTMLLNIMLSIKDGDDIRVPQTPIDCFYWGWCVTRAADQFDKLETDALYKILEDCDNKDIINAVTFELTAREMITIDDSDAIKLLNWYDEISVEFNTI